MRQPMNRRDRMLIGGLLSVVLGMAGTAAWPHLRRATDADLRAVERGVFPGGPGATADRLIRRAADPTEPAARRAQFFQIAIGLFDMAGRLDDARRACLAAYELVRDDQPEAGAAMFRAAYQHCPPADTRAGLDERRRLHAEAVRRAAGGTGRRLALDLAKELAADVGTFLDAHADALPPAERAALRRERRRLCEDRVGEWRTCDAADDLDRLARAVLDDGDRELAARIMERATDRSPDLEPASTLSGYTNARTERALAAVAFRHPDPCDLRQLDAAADALVRLTGFHRTEDDLLIRAFETAGRHADAVRFAEQLLELQQPGADSYDRRGMWHRLVQLAVLHRASGYSLYAREVELRAYNEYPDVACELSSGRHLGEYSWWYLGGYTGWYTDR